MFDLVPVDHDPFAAPPVKLIPVDHDPFAVGPAAQPADPAMAAAAAPRLVPVDYDPFAAATAGALPQIIVHPISPNAPPENPAGADGIDDWFVPTADGYPDDWFIPAPLATPGQSGSGAQSNAAVPPVANPPAVRPDPSAAYWSLIPASRAGAFAWHPPIFPNSAGQFPPPPAAYDPPILPVGGLFGGIGRKLAASVNGPGTGYGLFGSRVKLPAANTDAPPSILGDIAPLSYTAPTFASNPALPLTYQPHLGGSAPPSYLADPPPPYQSLFASLPQLQGPTLTGFSALTPWNSPPAIPFQYPAAAAPPTRSVLFNQAPAAWDPGAPDQNATNLDQTARTLGVSDLPLSKSGVPVVSPPPQLTTTRQQWLDVAHLLSPNLVDYFTKTLPPAPPLPPTPGKIPSSDNPYGPGAAFEAATWLLGGVERGIAGPLDGVASTIERSGTGAALQATGTAAQPTLNAATIATEPVSAPSTLERLLMHVDDARARLRRDGLTQKQRDSLYDNPQLEAAHRGERIDTFAKETVAKDQSLQHLVITPRFQIGPDFYDPVNNVWYDTTTVTQWPRHLSKYTDKFGAGTPLFYGDK
jgi:hypothetical protein